MQNLQIGDRVRIADHHRWNPGIGGRIYEIQQRSGNRFVVRLDYDPGNVWHDDDGWPCLRLNEKDLIQIEGGKNEITD
jgi:hypothetical protein